ncbi:hypothetical protein TWF696_008352 [Orbilia brochopaga]|uniref:G domain-containing protein n=1 Tax=Orbilia brochopaga TaxID=3140254 RepID=A0AAV9UIV4_9PEZI
MSFNIFKRNKESAATTPSRDRRSGRYETAAVSPAASIYAAAAESFERPSTASSAASSYNESTVSLSSSGSAPLSPVVMEHWTADTAKSSGSATGIRRKPVPSRPESMLGGGYVSVGRTETVAGAGVDSRGMKDTKRRPSETAVPAAATAESTTGRSRASESTSAGGTPSFAERLFRETKKKVKSADGANNSSARSRRAQARAGGTSAWSAQARKMIVSLTKHGDRMGSRGVIVLASAVVLVSLLWMLLLSDSGAIAGLTPTSPVIAIMGETGAGKSSFIKALGGRDGDGNPPVIGHTLNSTTKQATWYSAGAGKKGFYILDTPGFDDSYMSDFEILEGLTKELAAIYKDARPLTGIIYVHDISKEKMGKKSHKSLRTFQNLVGETSLKNVVLVTTHWNWFFKGAQTRREEELRTTFWSSMLARGSQILRHSGSRRSALRIVKMLLDREPVVIRIVEQTVRDRLPVGQTDAGTIVTDGLRDLEGKLVNNIASVNEEMADIKGRQEQIRKAAAAEAKRLEEEWKRASEQQREEIQRQMEEIKKKSEGEIEELSGQLANARNEKQALWNRIDSLQNTVKKLKDRIAEVDKDKSGPTPKRAARERARGGDGFFGRIRKSIHAAWRKLVEFLKLVLILFVTVFISGIIGASMNLDFAGFMMVFVPLLMFVVEVFQLPRLGSLMTLGAMFGVLVIVAFASASGR